MAAITAVIWVAFFSRCLPRSLLGIYSFKSGSDVVAGRTDRTPRKSRKETGAEGLRQRAWSEAHTLLLLPLFAVGHGLS